MAPHTTVGVHDDLSAGETGIRFGAGSSFLIVSEIVLSVAFLAMGGTLVRGAFQDTEGTLGFDATTGIARPAGQETAG